MDDDDRDLLLAEDALVCSQCGNLRAECSDPAVDWHPRTSVCWASASTAWGLRKLAEKHKNKHPGTDALHPTDGVSVWVSSIPPAEGQDEFA